MVTAPEVPEDDAKTEQENEGAMEIPSTEPVSPDEFDGSNQDALDEFLNREGQGTEVSPEPETVANSRASGIQGGWQGTEVSPEPETVEPEEEEASPSNSRMNVGDEPESDENTVAEPESGNGFWNEGTSAVTEDEIREEEDQQDSIASPEVDTNEDFNNDFFNDLMDEAETESDIVEIPERNRPSSGLRSGENEEEGQETPAEFRPLPPLSSAELDETIRVANLEIEDGEAAVQDSLLNRRVMRTADGQQVVGIAVVENEGGEAPVQNSRQTYLDKGISEEKLDECEQMYGPGNYETCLKENLANFVEGMMVESTGGLNIQPE